MTLAEAGLAGALASIVLAALLETQGWLRQRVARAALVCVACALLAGLYVLLAAQTGMRQILLVVLLALWATSLCYELRPARHPEQEWPRAGAWAPLLRMTVHEAFTIFLGAAPFLVVIFDRMPLVASIYSVAALLLLTSGTALKLHARRTRSTHSLYGNLFVLYGFFAYACESPSGWLTLLAPLLLQSELKSAFQTPYVQLDTSAKTLPPV